MGAVEKYPGVVKFAKEKKKKPFCRWQLGSGLSHPYTGEEKIFSFYPPRFLAAASVMKNRSTKAKQTEIY